MVSRKRGKPPEFLYEVLGIVLIAAGLLILASLFGLQTGLVGKTIATFSLYAVGVGAWIPPVILVIVGSCYIAYHRPIHYSLKFWSYLSLYCFLLTIYHHFVTSPGKEVLPESLTVGGGLVAGMLLLILRKLFGQDGALLLLLAASLAAFLLATAWSLAKGMLATRRRAKQSLQTAKNGITEAVSQISERYEAHQAKKGKFYDQEQDPFQDKVGEEEFSLPPVVGEAEFTNGRYLPKAPDAAPSVKRKKKTPAAAPAEQMDALQNITVKTWVTQTAEKQPVEMEAVAPSTKQVSAAEQLTVTTPLPNRPYQIPPLNLLKPGKKEQSDTLPEIRQKARILEETLGNFGIGVKMLDICQGPAVTRYELEPAPGVKVSKIVNLADDIALKLATAGIRMEAPIPGKAAIGIEVPNKTIASVHLREVLESSGFHKAQSPLTVGLGKDIAGAPILADLAKMPHLLVAGATGSGKSVCINTLISSILFRATPDEVKFVLIDPKMVELSVYNGIPHLLTPVVTDPKKAATALRWAVREMEQRYTLFAAAGVRDMVRFNQMHPEQRLPLIVVIIDELADLMMVAPVDVEDAICRLAQMARAAGLHLVLATQRPSVDVITGIIKANVPSRISFAVSSQVDSRTILDMGGAEKLLGKGDMLFAPVGSPKPLRVQGAFISDQEVEDLIQFIKRQGDPDYDDTVTEGGDDSGISATGDIIVPQDEMLEEAIRMVLETGQASVSMLQRKYRIGYTRAARLIDTMEEMKIVGPNVGSKAREILMTSDQVFELYFTKENKPQSD